MTRNYKRDCMKMWDEVAPRYQARWTGPGAGPFGCSDRMVEAVGIRAGDRILDMACGTGALTRRISRQVGPAGRVVGVDASPGALRVAVECGVPSNTTYVNADAESVSLAARFDAVTCQFGVFFFPDAPSALRNMMSVTRPGGRLGMAVHGTRKKVPYYGCIIDEVVSRIPDYISRGSPAMDRYSREPAFRDVAAGAGYRDVEVRAVTFRYSPGDFDAYWDGYVGYVAGEQRRKIMALGAGVRDLREAVRRRAAPYTAPDGTITFPWQVLILTASA